MNKSSLQMVLIPWLKMLFCKLQASTILYNIVAMGIVNFKYPPVTKKISIMV